jgi:hypothetical protein
MAGRLQRQEQRMRVAFLGCSTSWLGHNLLMSSAFGLVSDVLTLSGIGLGMWRHRRRAATAALTRTIEPASLPAPANDRGVERRAA